MSTRQNPNPPTTPVVTVWHRTDRGVAVVVRRNDERTTVARFDTEDLAEATAAYLRGVIADAYLAGQRDAAAAETETESYRQGYLAGYRDRAAEPDHLAPGDDGVRSLALADGSTLHLFHHHCDGCTSVDAWRTKPGLTGPDENTGAPERLATGWFGFRAGRRYLADGAEPEPGSKGWPAVTTSVLVWHD